MSDIAGLVWAGQFWVAVDSLRIGVQANRPDVLDALARAMARHRVPDVEGRPNYSVQFGTDPGEFHFLSWGDCSVVRTLDAARLVRALLGHLGGHRPPRPGLMRVPSLVLLRDGAAVLAPSDLRTRLARIERLLNRRGFAVVDWPWADIDPVRGTVDIGDHGLEVDADALAEVVTLAPTPRVIEPAVATGAYPIAAWTIVAAHGPARVAGRAEAVLATAGIAVNLPALGSATVVGLGELFARVPVRTSWAETPAELVDLIDAAAGGR